MLEEWMDILWVQVVYGVEYIVQGLDIIFTPLNHFGSASAIFGIAIFTVAITKLFTLSFTTKRYRALRAEFKYWYKIRQEALKCEDPEKAKVLSKNIDSAKLNEVYYNYFFESLMISLATKYLPIFSLLAYVNETFKSSNLISRFGSEHVFTIHLFGSPIQAGAPFWFVLSLIIVFIAWAIIGRWMKNRFPERIQRSPLPGAGPSTL